MRRGPRDVVTNRRGPMGKKGHGGDWRGHADGGLEEVLVADRAGEEHLEKG